MTDTPAAPTTEAGREMLQGFGTYTDLDGWPIADRILAIEAEARTTSAEVLDAAQAVADYSWGLHLAGTPNEDEAIVLIENLRLALSPRREESEKAHWICPDCNEPITDAAHWHEDEAAAARLRPTPAEALDVREAIGVMDHRHQSSLDIGRIVRAVVPRYNLYGLWVQYHGDGTNGAEKDEVVVSIQYGWSSDRRAEAGRGHTVREATSNLLARLSRNEEAE